MYFIFDFIVFSDRTKSTLFPSQCPSFLKALLQNPKPSVTSWIPFLHRLDCPSLAKRHECKKMLHSRLITYCLTRHTHLRQVRTEVLHSTDPTDPKEYSWNMKRDDIRCGPYTISDEKTDRQRTNAKAAPRRNTNRDRSLLSPQNTLTVPIPSPLLIIPCHLEG